MMSHFFASNLQLTASTILLYFAYTWVWIISGIECKFLLLTLENLLVFLPQDISLICILWKTESEAVSSDQYPVE